MSASKVSESDEIARRFGTSEEYVEGRSNSTSGKREPKEGCSGEKIKVAVSSLQTSGDQTLAHLDTTTQRGCQHEADQLKCWGEKASRVRQLIAPSSSQASILTVLCLDI